MPNGVGADIGGADDPRRAFAQIGRRQRFLGDQALSRVANAMVATDPKVSVAVVAVDPSSPLSGGALLGDRTRMAVGLNQDRIYFRSQASATALGGLAPTTFQVCRALALIYDFVIVETVGVGQSEADIRRLADRVFLVMAPLGGDEIQFLKAGIIEIPDAFVVNKCDEATANRTYHQLRGSLGLARPNDGQDIPTYRTSAKTGDGVDELARAFLAMANTENVTPLREKASHFFAAWVQDEWGRVGAWHLAEQLGGARAFLATQNGFASARKSFDVAIRAALRG